MCPAKTCTNDLNATFVSIVRVPSRSYKFIRHEFPYKSSRRSEDISQWTEYQSSMEGKS